MGSACGTYGGGENIHIAFEWSNRKERNHLEGRPLDETLKGILKN